MSAPSTLTDDRDEILAAVDLLELFASEVGPQGFNRQWPCPVHEGQTGKSPPVNLFPADFPTRWYCHACHAGGTAIDLLIETRGIDVGEAFTALRELTGIRAQHTPPGTIRPAPKPRARQAPPPAKATDRNPDADLLTGPDADLLLAEYIDWRGWPAALAAEAGLTPVRVTVAGWRGVGIRHPFTIGGKTFTWQDRPRGPNGFTFNTGTAGAPHVKWVTAPGTRSLPYGVDQLGHLTERPQGDRPSAVILCEGPADALTVRAEWPDAVALGTQGAAKWGRRESAMLSRAGVRLVLIVVDNDTAGRNGFDTITKELRPWRIKTRAVNLPDELAGEPTPKGADLTDWAGVDGQAFAPRFTAALRAALGRVPIPDDVADVGLWAKHEGPAFRAWQALASSSPPLLAPLLGDRREVAT